jgi:2-phospho-L-lactate guanylyltransferase
MTWTAIVPLKQGPHQMSRLASSLSQTERAALSDVLAWHVLETIRRSPSVETLVLLSPRKPGWAGAQWARDRGRGLNGELAHWRAATPHRPIIVLHADLPLLRSDDVEAMIAGATASGVALAADRHGTGTNAMALAGHVAAHFAFGEDSLARHRLALPAATILETTGLSIDIDSPEDLSFARAAGFKLPDNLLRRATDNSLR